MVMSMDLQVDVVPPIHWTKEEQDGISAISGLKIVGTGRQVLLMFEGINAEYADVTPHPHGISLRVTKTMVDQDGIEMEEVELFSEALSKNFGIALAEFGFPEFSFVMETGKAPK